MDTGKATPEVTAADGLPAAPVAGAMGSHGQQDALVSAAGVPVLTSTELLQGGKSVLISHKGEVYRLQSTRQGKLILTK